MDRKILVLVPLVAIIALAALLNNTEADDTIYCPTPICISPDIKVTCPEPVCDMECPETQCYEPDTPLFLREAQNVADAHDYEEGVYVCLEYARELKRRLVADGYDARVCYGVARWCEEETIEHDCWHAWVKIGAGDGIVIEAVSGKHVPPKQYKEEYDERYCYD